MSVQKSDTEPCPEDASVCPNIAAASESGAIQLSDGEFVLPSGKVARVRAGKGLDIQRASRIVGDIQKEGPMALVMAIAAIKTTVDGRGITYEDLLEMGEDDVWVLVGKSQMGKGLSPPIISRS